MCAAEPHRGLEPLEGAIRQTKKILLNRGPKHPNDGPRKLHLVLEGTDTKNGNRKQYFFRTFGTPTKQTPPKKRFSRDLLVFFNILFGKMKYYFPCVKISLGSFQ